MLQFLRIFVPTRRTNKTVFVLIWTVIGLNFGFYLIDTIFEIIMCIPRKKIWDPLMSTGHCFDYKAVYRATGIFNVVSDFAVLIIPMISICRLQLPLRKKLMLATVFATGIWFVKSIHPTIPTVQY